MRISRLLVSAIFLLSCAGGEAIAKGAAKNGPPKKPQQEQTQDKSKGGGGFAVKAGKSGGHGGDNWEKDSKKKDPF